MAARRPNLTGRSAALTLLEHAIAEGRSVCLSSVRLSVTLMQWATHTRFNVANKNFTLQDRAMFLVFLVLNFMFFSLGFDPEQILKRDIALSKA